eukprot:12341456-Ditylum_brightwellii.AAC.1
MYHHVVPNSLTFDNMPIPHRTNNKAARAVGTYADVLVRLGNIQDEMDTGTNPTDNSLNTNPIRARKCTSVDLDAVAETQMSTAEKQSDNTASTVSNTITEDSLTAQLNEFRAEMMKANKTFYAQKEQQMKEDTKNMVQTQIKSVQKDLAQKFLTKMQ